MIVLLIVFTCIAESVACEVGADWPSQGAIEFDCVSLRYDPTLAPVVHRLSVSIRPGEKVQYKPHYPNVLGITVIIRILVKASHN